MTITITKGDTVDFSLVNDTIDGGKRSGVTLTSGVMDYALAVQISPDINSKHANFYQYFKDKVDNIDNPAKYDYFAYADANGNQKVVGIPWVLESTWKSIQNKQETYVIVNFQEYMRPTIENTLNNLGASFFSKDTSPS